MKRSRFIAVLLVGVMMFGVIQSACAGQITEKTLSVIVRGTGGGIIGFLLCGPLAALAGAGLMCIIHTPTGCFCEGGGGPCGPIVVK